METNLIQQPCPHCSKILHSRGFFCPSCYKQARCKKCSEVLEKDVDICLMCGTVVVIPTTSENKEVSNIISNSLAINNLEFQQKGNSKLLKANLTDNAVTALASTLGYFATNGSLPLKGKSNRLINLNSKTSNPNQLQIPTGEMDNNIDKDGYTPIELVDDDIEDVLRKIFSFEDEQIKVLDTRLKQNGKLDKAIRLSILIVFAYELIGKSQVEKTTVREILKQFNSDNGHSSTWITSCDEFIREGSTLKLSGLGRDNAIAIIKEIMNNSINEGKILFSKTGVGTGKSKTGKQKKDKSSDKVASNTTNSSGRLSPMQVINILIGDGFFKEKQQVKDILKQCSMKGYNFKNNELSTPLIRIVRENKLKREKNSSDNQYEYFL